MYVFEKGLSFILCLRLLQHVMVIIENNSLNSEKLNLDGRAVKTLRVVIRNSPHVGRQQHHVFSSSFHIDLEMHSFF